MTDIKSMTLEELDRLAGREQGEPAFRAKQIFHWLYLGASPPFDEMTGPVQGAAGEAVLPGLPDASPGGQKAGVPAGRHHQIPVGAVRRQLCGVSAHAPSAREYCVSPARWAAAWAAPSAPPPWRERCGTWTPAEMIDQVLFTQLDSGAPISNIVPHGDRGAAGQF